MINSVATRVFLRPRRSQRVIQRRPRRTRDYATANVPISTAATVGSRYWKDTVKHTNAAADCHPKEVVNSIAEPRKPSAVVVAGGGLIFGQPNTPAQDLSVRRRRYGRMSGAAPVMSGEYCCIHQGPHRRSFLHNRAPSVTARAVDWSENQVTSKGVVYGQAQEPVGVSCPVVGGIAASLRNEP